jgi:hypothetical protein
MTKQVDAILAKEMSRKEFLATVGLGLTAAAGLTSIVNIFGGGRQAGTMQVDSGYGSSAYGGYTKSAQNS